MLLNNTKGLKSNYSLLQTYLGDESLTYFTPKVDHIYSPEMK